MVVDDHELRRPQQMPVKTDSAVQTLFSLNNACTEARTRLNAGCGGATVVNAISAVVMNSFEIIRIFFEESTTSISDIVTHDTINLAVTDFAAPERMNRPPHALSIDEQCRLFAVLRDWLPYPKASGLNHLVRTLESRGAGGHWMPW
jgi:hypothetical protein